MIGSHDASSVEVAKLTGLIETADAASGDNIIPVSFYADVPWRLQQSHHCFLNIVPTVPQYYVALSLLGIIMTLLILNWFSRTRSSRIHKREDRLNDSGTTRFR